MSKFIKMAILSLMLFLTTAGLSAQECRVGFFLRNTCTGELFDAGCYVVDNDGVFHMSKDSYFILTKGEQYNVRLYFHRNEPFTVSSRDFTYKVVGEADVIVDIPRIERFEILKADSFESASFAYVYMDCKGLCNGHCMDYYDNGNKRIEGRFKKGIPVGKLYFYKEDGSLDYIAQYSRKGVLLKYIQNKKKNSR